jgi:hypothetical protein
LVVESGELCPVVLCGVEHTAVGHFQFGDGTQLAQAPGGLGRKVNAADLQVVEELAELIGSPDPCGTGVHSRESDNARGHYFPAVSSQKCGGRSVMRVCRFKMSD